jgi:processive 1,2-diacylglycerol beta-glucosyltransferase/1,2-diacylglycerol 3-beta-galactosyltransferase
MKKDHIVKRFHFAIGDKFSNTLLDTEIISIKKSLGFNPAKRLVLLLGGGDGIPKGEKILHAILKANIDTEIGIVCGKNEVLKNGVEEQKKKYKADNVKIYGYSDSIYELINISDMVITKCGASTIMEILNLKKVPIVIDYIWEQEQGNVDYIINKKLGIYEPQIDKLPQIVKRMLEDDKIISFYKDNILKENVTNGVKEVAEYLRIY